MIRWWLSSPKITIGVTTNAEGIIQAKDCPPIIRKFIGQHVMKLARWMKADIVRRLDASIT